MDGPRKRVADRRPVYASREGCPPGGPLHDARVTDPDDGPRGVGRAVAELTLLLPYQQLEALESAAARHEMTVGQMLRRLVHDGLAGLDDAPGPEGSAPPSSCALRADHPRPGHPDAVR